MDLHFVSTAANFPYLYYLSIMSALKTQKVDNVNLWVTIQPEGKYFEKLKGVKVIYMMAPQFPALVGRFDHFRFAHTKDYIAWQILYEYGGILMDLDTFSLLDISCLLGDKEVAITPFVIGGVSLYPFNNAILIAKPESVIIEEVLDESTQVLMNKNSDDDMLWGASGPMALSHAIMRHYDLVEFVKYGTFGEVFSEINQQCDLQPLREDGVPDPVTRVLHLYASQNKEMLYGIDEKWVATSKVLLAKLVRQVLSKSEWNIK